MAVTDAIASMHSDASAQAQIPSSIRGRVVYKHSLLQQVVEIVQPLTNLPYGDAQAILESQV